MFLVSLPVALAALALFETLLKRPLLALSPDTIRLRIPASNGLTLPSISDLVRISISAILGLCTHVVWDSLTQSSGILVMFWPVLRESTQFWPHRPIFRFLQPFFSVVGLCAIAIAYRSWLHRTPPCRVVVPSVSSGARRIALLLSGALFAFALALIYTYFSSRATPVEFGTLIEHFLFGSMAAGFFMILSFSFWWYLRPAFQATRACPER